MKKIISILLAVLFYGNIMSQNLNDTIKIQAIEVLAKKPLGDIGKSKTEIDSLVIQESINESMAELLSNHSNVFIKQAGKGSLATISFRGTSASHTDVLWNDLSIKSPMLGQVDFSLLPLYFFDNIDIYSGGSSIEKSNGALGGAINISNNAVWDDDKKIKVIQNIGSFHTTTSFLKFNLGRNNFRSKTKILYTYSKNDFEFINKNIADINPETGEYIYPTQKNKNADYEQKGIMQEFYYKTRKNLNLSLKYWSLISNRELPRLNTFEGDDYSNRSNQTDHSERIIASADYYKGKSKFSYKTAFVYQDLDYIQRNYISGKGYLDIVSSNSWSKTFNNKLNYRYSINQSSQLNINMSINNDNVSSYDYVSKQGYDKKRNEVSLFAGYNKRFKERFGLSLMLRKYISSDYDMPFSPFVGLEYLLNKKQNINIKLNLSKNYKNPDLNDLYWQPGGNIKLKPEENLSADLGINLEKKYKKTSIKTELTGFYSDVKNWIIWIPTPMGYWTPENISNVISKGIEYQLSIKYKLKKFSFAFVGNYAYTDAKNYGSKDVWGDESYGKQLAYIPVHSGNLLFSVTYYRFNITYTHNSYSERYTTSSNDISLRDWLYPYYMNNVSFSKKLTLNRKYDFGISFKIYNLFNEEYRSVLGRPMPGINYLLSLNLDF